MLAIVAEAVRAVDSKKTLPKAPQSDEKKKEKLTQLEKARNKLKELRAAAAKKGEKYISKRRSKKLAAKQNSEFPISATE